MRRRGRFRRSRGRAFSRSRSRRYGRRYRASRGGIRF